MARDARGDLLLGPQPLTREEFDAQVASAMRVVENGKSANTGSPKLTAACGDCPLQYVCKGPSLFNTMACRGARSQLRAGCRARCTQFSAAEDIITEARAKQKGKKMNKPGRLINDSKGAIQVGYEDAYDYVYRCTPEEARFLREAGRPTSADVFFHIAKGMADKEIVERVQIFEAGHSLGWREGVHKLRRDFRQMLGI